MKPRDILMKPKYFLYGIAVLLGFNLLFSLVGFWRISGLQATFINFSDQFKTDNEQIMNQLNQKAGITEIDKLRNDVTGSLNNYEKTINDRLTEFKQEILTEASHRDIHTLRLRLSILNQLVDELEQAANVAKQIPLVTDTVIRSTTDTVKNTTTDDG
jgi:hypothetical protein